MEETITVIGKEKLEGLSEPALALRKNDYSIRAYLEKLKERFTEMEDKVRAFLQEEPDRFVRLEREAAALKAEYPRPDSRPALFGVPVGVKDIIRCDGFPTRAGSLLPAEELEGPEADVVRTLKRAGALILGKTVTTEFAYFKPGPTRNPHDLDRTPGGSSSGSAAAAACGLSPLTIGTQTIGSVIRPAAFCGVYGFKPSYGRISLNGVIPFAPSVDHIGFFCRDIEGIRLAASVLCDGWRASAESHPSRVLGVPKGPYLENTSPEGMARFDKILSHLEIAGYTLVHTDVLGDFEAITEAHNHVVAAEAAAVHEKWFSKYPDLYSDRLKELFERGSRVTAAQLDAGRRSCLELRNAIKRTMEQHGMTALLAPSAPGPAPASLDSTGDPVMNLPWTHAGVPAINVPSGVTSSGMPLGLQLIGTFMKDEELLDLTSRLNVALW